MSPDGTLMTEWVQITVTPMDSKKHVRVDFTLSPLSTENTVNTCDLEPRVPVSPVAQPTSEVAAESAAQKIQVLEHLSIFLVFQIVLLTNYI